MVKIHLYFPATVLMDYVDASSIGELKVRIKESKVSVLGELLKSQATSDIHTTIRLPRTLKNYLYALRDRLRQLVLGKEVILYFRKEDPIELEAEEEYELVFDLNPNIANKLKIRRRVVAERLLLTDMIFRLYLHLYDDEELKNLFKEYHKLPKFLTPRQDSRLSLLESYTPLNGNLTRNISDVRLPEQVRGMVLERLPLLSFSGVVQLALMLHIKERKWEAYYDKTPKMTEELDNVYDEWVSLFERSIESYKHVLSRYITEFKAILKEEDPIERFILSSLPGTFFDIYNRARAVGFDPDEVMHKISDLIRRGKVRVDGELLK